MASQPPKTGADQGNAHDRHHATHARARRGRRAVRLPSAARAQGGHIVTRIIVPFPPGGTVDPIARMVQPALQQKLGATIIIENKPGASGSIGTALVAKSPPDGSNWVFVFDTHAVNPFLQSLPFDTEKDLDPVLLIGTAPNVMATHPGRPFKTFADVDRGRQGQARHRHLRLDRQRQPRPPHHGAARRSAPASKWCTCPIAAAGR